MAVCMLPKHETRVRFSYPADKQDKGAPYLSGRVREKRRLAKNNNMKLAQLIKQGFAYSTATAAYILLVMAIMTNAERIGNGNELIAAAAMLTLFVFSAAVTGSLVLGKPVLTYLDGAKKDAVKLLAANLIWLFFWLVIFFSLALIYG